MGHRYIHSRDITSDPNYVYEATSNGHELNTQLFLNWDKKITDHNISAMVVYEYLSNEASNFNARRQAYDINLEYLFAGPDLNKTNTGSASYGGRVGFVSRVNYDFKGKY